ncbi:U4/U6.U5 tri-snRNP-associated protein snu66 [Histoplasma capsulatum var. duboisii H88]|uniref:U4/U6.U5 tri-snRNP-associated protein snu66 n=1 Tax=Ajellomyces capsulatus (strain H88) TaxID=544711 RepID=F0U5F2_AJEC8|nr:U4/U6.U5 tri-snRNP-associated protein snu66 [Histoplasma capsulatum var. duboisii H88]
MADALSIEQNNKIRIALGLKPLPVPGATDNNNDGPVFKPSRDGNDSDSSGDEPASTLESRQAQGYDNWKKYQDEAEAKKKRQEKLDAIKRAREKAQKLVKLEGKGLGELDSEEAALDTKTWLKQQKKRQRKVEKERAKRLAEELAERERIAEYTAKDLAGVRVGHELGDFEAGGEQILTLKDTTIDENEEEGDELENIDLRDRERLNERLALKKKKPVYDPNDFDGSGSGSILAQYDEEIDGKKRKRFTLDAKVINEEERMAKRQDVSSKLKAQPVNLDIMPETTATPSDYQEATDIKIKKPKKKKTKSTRRKAVDEDDIFPTIETTDIPNGGTGVQSNGDNMEVDSVAPSNGLSTRTPRQSDRDVSFVDDEDLQASLAAQRRTAFKKRKKESEQAQNGMDLDNANGEDDGPGLVIDETSEFVANLQRPTLPDRRQRSVSRPKEASPEVKEERHEDVDMDMERSYNDIEDEEDLQERLKRSDTTPAADITATGLEEESTLDKGLGATLAMLKQRGLVKESNASELNTLHRERQRFLQEKQRREAEAERRARLQRERDRASGKLDRMTARDREEYARQENKQRDQLESRQMAEIFNREYKPDVQLKYVDDFGRLMDQKEAFKHLSHQFHGKGSGKMKTEKHLKKIEEEKKREAMSTLDSSQHTGMNNAMGATARRNRQAGVRLG